MTERKATVSRDTLETRITVSLNLDGTGKARFNTGVPFLEHMLDQIARHGLVDLDIEAVGDTHIDDHHTVEDIGITLGQAFTRALGDKKGIRRYGHAYVPLDEALSRVVVDFSGRPGLEMHVDFTRASVGAFDLQLTYEFFQGFVNHAGVTLHIDNLRGVNAHHQIETIFKAFGRALRMAAEPDPRMAGVMPSTKGTISFGNQGAVQGPRAGGAPGGGDRHLRFRGDCRGRPGGLSRGGGHPRLHGGDSPGRLRQRGYQGHRRKAGAGYLRRYAGPDGL